MLVEVRPTRSLQEIIKRRQPYDFVGRESHVSGFRENLALSLDDERRRFVYDVHGPEGVGKTWLLRRFNAVAQQSGMLTVWIDELDVDVVDVMEQIATRIETQGRSMAGVTDRLRAYRRHSIIGLRFPVVGDSRRRLPDCALIKSVAVRNLSVGRFQPSPFDRETTSSWPSDHLPPIEDDERGPRRDGRNIFGGTSPNETERGQSSGESVHALTVAFVRALRNVAQDLPIALFFDGYEQAGCLLDDWLRGILEGLYGELPASTIIGIAGRERLDGTGWSGFEAVIAHVRLDAFSDEEARAFLTRKGITNDRLVDRMIRATERMPLLLATLALRADESWSPSEVGSAGEVAAVLLQSIDDPRRRSALLDAALPRRLDAEVLRCLVDHSDASMSTEWLRNLPFAEKRGDVWLYRPAVRRALLQQARRESPKQWSQVHARLASYYEWAIDAGGEERLGRAGDVHLDRAVLEQTYHRLCASPDEFLATALGGLVSALGDGLSSALRWAETIREAGEDAEDKNVRDWGECLLAGLRAYSEGRYGQAAELLDRLIEAADLSDYQRSEAAIWLGRLQVAGGRMDRALRVYTRLLEASPNVASYWNERGVVLARLGHYSRAVEDFTRALDLAPDDVFALANRGEAYRLLESYDAALADFARALTVDADQPAVLGSRGQVYVALERCRDGLEDLNRAIALAPNEAWLLAERGCAYRGLQRYDEALADLNQALRLDPGNVWALAVRGDVQWQLKRGDAARADFNRALALKLRTA